MGKGVLLKWEWVHDANAFLRCGGGAVVWQACNGEWWGYYRVASSKYYASELGYKVGPEREFIDALLQTNRRYLTAGYAAYRSAQGVARESEGNDGILTIVEVPGKLSA